MPANITDVDEFTDPIDYPIDTEDADQASLERFIQDLANRTRYLRNRTHGVASMPVTKADTEAGAELATAIHSLGASGTSEYWLINEWEGSGQTEKLREYILVDGSGLSRVVTWNALWDAGTGTWSVDAAGKALRTVTGPATYVQHADASTTSGGWSDADWFTDGNALLSVDQTNHAGIVQLLGDLGSAATPGQNTLYSDSMPKAWGVFTTDGVGGVTVEESFNVLSASLSTATLTVTLRRGFTSANYHVSPSGGGGAVDEQPRGFGSTATTISLSMLDSSAGTLIDLEANARGLSFAAVGRQ